MSTGRRLPPGGCSWCGHGPHDDECPHPDCPCAYRKAADQKKDA